MPTPVGFERWEPGHPWGDVVFDDGSRTSVSDPDGSIEGDVRQSGARYSANPDLADPMGEATQQAPLTGAANALPAEDATANIPPPPPPPPRPGMTADPATPLPTGAPPTPAETAPLQASPGELAGLAGQAPPGAPPNTPGTSQNPAADVVALHGITPPAAAAPAAPGAPGAPTEPGAAPTAPPGAAGQPAPQPPPPDGMSHAEASIRALAPDLIPEKAEVKSEGPDAQNAQEIRDVAGEALLQRGKAINETVQAGTLNNQDQAQAADQAYYQAWIARNQALGDAGALTTARDQAAATLATVKQTPVQPHQDFAGWFVGLSILGGLAGGAAEGFSGGKVRNSTLDMLNEIVNRWVDVQKYNKGLLVSSLEQQLGDKNAAIMVARGKFKDALADQADAKARFARSTEGMRQLGATAATLRAQALDDYNKTQAVVMGKATQSVKFGAPKAGAGPVLDNDVTRELAVNGVSPKAYAEGLEKKIGAGENAPTLNGAVDRVLQVEADWHALHSLAATNGGKLSGKGLINIPQALVPTLARIGIKQGMDAEEVHQIYVEYMVKAAKAMGSRVTEKELDIAGQSMGSSTAAFFRMMRRIHDETNESIRSTADLAWPGAGQKILDIHRRASAANKGFPLMDADAFEAENAEETGPPDRPSAQQTQDRSADETYLASLTPEQRAAEVESRKPKPVVPASQSIGAQKKRDFSASKF